MIAELGLALLWIAAALACLSLVAGTLFLRGGPKDLAALVRPASVAQGVLTAAAFGLLIALFVRSDMSVELVARNSNSLKPMIFKIAGTWGNHEGSMLLWLMILSLSGGLIAIRSEEHTSELQSLMRTSYAVFCLKKKTINDTNVAPDGIIDSTR